MTDWKKWEQDLFRREREAWSGHVTFVDEEPKLYQDCRQKIDEDDRTLTLPRLAIMLLVGAGLWYLLIWGAVEGYRHVDGWLSWLWNLLN